MFSEQLIEQYVLEKPKLSSGISSYILRLQSSQKIDLMPIIDLQYHYSGNYLVGIVFQNDNSEVHPFKMKISDKINFDVLRNVDN